MRNAPGEGAKVPRHIMRYMAAGQGTSGAEGAASPERPIFGHFLTPGQTLTSPGGVCLPAQAHSSALPPGIGQIQPVGLLFLAVVLGLRMLDF